MADGGRTDYWAPNSDLDSDPLDPGVNYITQDGRTVNVKPNDWLDLDENIPLDPLWGSSFQVIECQEEQVIIKMYNPTNDLYEPCAITVNYILNNYRKVTKE